MPATSNTQIPANQLIIHPYSSKLQTQRQLLQNRLAEILQRFEEQKQQADYLESLFNSRLGKQELDRLKWTAEIAILNKQLQEAQKLKNHGVPLNEKFWQKIKTTAARERANWQEKITAQQVKTIKGNRYLHNLTPVDPDTIKKAKQLYLRITRQIHPDIIGGNHQLFKAWWPLVQNAYQSADIEVLSAIDRSLDATPLSKTAGWETLQNEISRLEKKEKRLLKRLAKNQNTPPLCYQQELENPAWVTKKENSLRQEITDLIEKVEQLNAQLQCMKENTTLH